MKFKNKNNLGKCIFFFQGCLKYVQKKKKLW